MGSEASNIVEWPANKVRDTFIQFFGDKGHVYWKSSPVVPRSDPTGMNQFKPIFLGAVDPNSELRKLKRACNNQKCILEGKDTYHHTFFEMLLCNWSLGDYCKSEAIEWTWELLTKVYKLPGDRIYVTYFGGDDKLGLPADNEARDIWLKLLPPTHVLPFACKNNFWEMGDTGSCGPCTEIHFDRIGGRNAASFVNSDDPTVIEIWNNVFIEFNREADGSLKSLPAKHVDTGMGFERLTSVLQNKISIYDTDIFMPLFDAIQRATKARPYSGKIGKDDVDNVDMAYRVVADRIRTLSFAIADGSRPGNKGHEYVLRCILNQAVRYGTEFLKAPPGFFNRLVHVVVDKKSGVFPELKDYATKIREIIADEEASFGRTLTKVIKIFKMKAAKGEVLTGQDAFYLWDTYGFPLDLTQLMAEERGFIVDVQGFNFARDEARERSMIAHNKHGVGAIRMDVDATASLHKRGIGATDDSFKFSWFQDHKGVIKAVYTGSEFVESVAPGSEVGLVLETTSFYAEQGGQIYDTGLIEGPGGTFLVANVQLYGGFVLHVGSLIGKTGSLNIGDKVICKVDYNRRTMIATNHTCTHMLNFALREVLGNHAQQKGSIILPEKLTFDFYHRMPLKLEEVRKIESIVNEQIKAELEVYSKETRLADAERIKGLRVVSGKVYPDPVRVVSVGRKVDDLLADPESEEWLSISAEFCGGTHISNTREAGEFAIMSVKGIAKGIRRVNAVTRDSSVKANELADSFALEIKNLEQEVYAAKKR